MKFLTLIQNIKRKLFGAKSQAPTTEPIKHAPAVKESIPESEGPTCVPSLPSEQDSSPQITYSVPAHPKKRQPYFIQIGFDFGTSYSKCICRDMITDKAWVHVPTGCQERELPFLIPCALILKDEKIGNVENPGYHYPENGLYHIKQALVKTALHQWDDQVLLPYRSIIGTSDLDKLSALVEDCAVFFLASALGEIRASIHQRMPDFGALPDDYMAVNLAVPIADAERKEVNALYGRLLCESWSLADELAGHPPIPLRELELLRKKNSAHSNGDTDKACFIYPEVSANVQGFVRSRVSSPGMYLFSDTGASTVDQGVFIFSRDNYKEELVYLTGRVLPLGSSNIERRAANNSGKMDLRSLESWREMKERGVTTRELVEAKGWVQRELTKETIATLAFSKQKLYVKQQLEDIRVIFGGGGHCDYPYKTAVMNPFSGDLFRQDIRPDIVGLPVPKDLEIKVHEERWLKRLSVAYGLSFEKSELASFTYPSDVSIPKLEEIWQPRRIIPDAPSKDDC